MTILQLTLLGFALWTLGILTMTVGVYRWSRILTGRSDINEFPADASNGAGWYQRGTRAHANCVENLPVYTVIVMFASSQGATHPVVDALGIAFLCARVLQTVTHVAFEQTRRAVAVRFTFFSLQIVAMVAILVLGWRH